MAKSTPTKAELDAAVEALEHEAGKRREAKWLAGEWQPEVRIVDEGLTLSQFEAKYGADGPRPQ
jgi:hypothetical protein